ncbi:MAG: acyltransferase family protein [Ardenticatenaceae bacterium]|nr:acyltransferase family protein [Ardenticatenaceae bacterium]
MTTKEKSTSETKRLHFLDNLRTVIIFLVILYHAGGVYEATGFWASFWIVDDPAINNISGLIGLVTDIFVMSTLFFISGYLAPPSLKKRQVWGFIKRKLSRLIVPWAIAVLTLIPLYKVIYLYSRSLPQEHWTSYFHFSNGNISSQNWLWFLPVLFVFNLLYLLFSKANIRMPNLSLKSAVFSAFLIGFVYSLGMDIFNLRGWTLTPFLDFQHEMVLTYFMFFLLGIFSYRLKILDTKPENPRLYYTVSTLSAIPILVYIIFLLSPLFSPGNFIVSQTIDRVVIWFSFQLSLFSMVYVMIETFWRYFDKTGALWRELNQNSYYVYIIHVIVLGVIATLLLNTAMPSLLKYMTLAVSTFIVSNILVSLYYRAATRLKPTYKPKLRGSQNFRSRYEQGNF